MINPDGTPGTSFAQGAMTRFNNAQINAQRSGMPMNQAAQMSIRLQTSKSTPKGPAVNNNVQQPQAPVMTAPIQSTGPIAPVMPTPQQPANSDNVLNEIVGRIRTQQFLGSPRVQDATQAVRLKAFFNSGNVTAAPDPRSLFEKVVARVQNGLAQ